MLREVEPGSFSVALESGRLAAALLPRDHYDLCGFADFMTDLAGGALEGWRGIKRWVSLERDIEVAATSRGGHITLAVKFIERRSEPDNDGWRVHLDITLDPGEELREAAREVRSLLQVS